MRVDWGSSGKMFPSSVSLKKTFRTLISISYCCAHLRFMYVLGFIGQNQELCVYVCVCLSVCAQAHILREMEAGIVSSEKSQLYLRSL